MTRSSPATGDLAVRGVIADAIRSYCRRLSPAAVMKPHDKERIYYAGIDLDGLSDAIFAALPDAAATATASADSVNKEGARLSNWLTDYSHDLKEDGDFDQEAAELDRVAQWIAARLSDAAQARQVTDEMVLRGAQAMAENAGFCWDNCAQSQWISDMRVGLAVAISSTPSADPISRPHHHTPGEIK